MYAVVRDGGKQYLVREGETVYLDLKDGLQAGAAFDFADVLFVGNGESVAIGRPLVTGAKVQGTVQGEVKGDKLVILKFRRRKGSKTKTGHRQPFTAVRIDKITSG